MPEHLTFLVDGNGMVAADWHAASGTNAAVRVSTSRLAGLVQKYEPDSLVVAFDSDGETFRHEAYPAYKANREPCDPDRTRQVNETQKVLGLCGVQCVTAEGYEGDDIIASLVSVTPGLIVIFSIDKDCRQLLERGRVSIARKVRSVGVGMSRDIEVDFYTADTLREDLSLTPEMWVDFQALCGDSVDNIPGAGGIGPVTARRLLNEHGTLDEIYGKLHNIIIGETIRSSLLKFEEQWKLSRFLVTLKRDVLLHVPQPPVNTKDLQKTLQTLSLPNHASRLVPLFERSLHLP